MCAPAGARAGNDDELLLGNRAAMLGGAVMATVDDSSSTWYNPAGLGSVDRDQVDVSGTAYTLRMYSASNLLATPSGANRDGSVTEFVAVPTQIAYVRRLSARATLGLGYFAPNASNYVLRVNLRDRWGDPPSQWQLAATGAEVQHRFAAAFGHALSERVRIGGSVVLGYGTATTSVFLFGAVSPDGQARASNSLNLLDTTSRISLDVSLGMQIDLSPNFVLGFTYRSPEVQVYANSSTSYNVSITSLVDLENPQFGIDSNTLERASSWELLRAGRIGAGLGYRYAAGAITAELDMQPGLERPRVDVDRKLVFNARLGWYHRLSEWFAFGLGAFSDRSSAGKRFDLIDGSGDFYGGTLGVELSNKHLLAAQEHASSLIFTSVFALRYAHTSGPFGTILANPQQITSMPFFTAENSIEIHELSLYVGAGLQF